MSDPVPPAPRVAREGAVHHEIDEALPEGDEAQLTDEVGFGEGGAAGGGRKRRRRGRRGGRGRRRSGAEGAGGVEGDAGPTHASEVAGGDLVDEEARLEAPRRGRGRGAVPAPAAVTAVEEDEDLAPADDDAPEGGVLRADGGRDRRKKRRRRGSRGGRKQRRDVDAPVEVEAIPGETEDDLPERAPEPVQAAPAEPRGGRPDRSRRRKGARVSEDEDEEPLPKMEPARKALILVNASDPEEKRVAVVEDGQIADFQMTVRTENSVVNDIYRGRVVNLEPAVGAAFVDFGQGRNGFLHTSDVLSAYGDKDWSLDKLLTTTIDPDEWDSNSSQPHVGAEVGDEEAAAKKKPQRGKDHRRFRARPRLPITDLLKKGEMVVVQVTKDAIGDKGPTLTTYISIPGRYLVLMPSMSRTGVSRKIEDEKERRRLKKILAQLEIPPGMGVIVRTAGVGHSKADLKRDLDYLKGAWETFAKRLRHGHGPAPLYQESDIAIRTVRDLFTPGTEAVVCDDPTVHQQIEEFTQKLMPEALDRVKLYTGPKPLFHSYGIESDFEKIFSRRIDLPSGGSIVFDQAEALVAIDVNSGRTRSDGFDFEEIALKTNLEAAPEIARQVRLRDLGGIIVVDFIDMMKMSNIKSVERAFKAALDTDRARNKIGRISQFGLLELTRQRLGPGMNKKVFTPCHRCRGTGRIRTVESRAAAILRRLGSAMTLKGFTTVEVRAHPEVVRYLRELCSEYLRALEYRFEREIKLNEVPDQVEDSVLRYLRADGREVRPGGRRKR
ncbi:MAG: Rne/Rng family ribonuclease [Planctomycetes bacterium]|nr:Rne/Rng family ribonuclease [Planctomycetota bacterium]